MLLRSTDAIKQQPSSSLFNNLANILSIYPFVGASLKATLLLFDPKLDTYLEGKVVKLADDAIHFVILGFSASIITEENIRDEFRFKIKHGREIFRSTSHKRHVIKLGTTILFLVKRSSRKRVNIDGTKEKLSSGTVDVSALSSDTSVLKKLKTQRRLREG